MALGGAELCVSHGIAVSAGRLCARKLCAKPVRLPHASPALHPCCRSGAGTRRRVPPSCSTARWGGGAPPPAW